MSGYRDRPSARTKVTVGIPTYNRSAWLREAVESALAQSYGDFRLLICDNASEDDTEDVVKSFGDPRIDYQRSPSNVGMIANFNRVMNLAESDFLVILPDDDALHPEYLRSTVAEIESHPSVGLVHTGYDLVDQGSQVMQSGRVLTGRDGQGGFESRDAYLERSMRSLGGAVCWASALFRTRAMLEAGGLNAGELPFADIPLFMRIALHWDFFSLSAALVRLRVHQATETAALGSFTGDDYDIPELPKILLDHRMRFLETAGLEPERKARYRAQAQKAYLEGSVRSIATRATLDGRWSATAAELGHLVRREPRTLVLSSTWRLVVGQLGGRRAKQLARRMRGRRG
jgi:glycosyltransferase involved in cell wall biosynthesis